MQTAHVKLWAHNAVDSERNVAYQAARAKGGAGLLITGNRVVHPTSTTGFPRVAWAYRPEALESDRRLTVCRARARRRDLRAAEPLRAQRDERLRGRLPGSLGPVRGEVAGLRGDAEGDGARGHPRGGRVVGPLRRAHARGRLRRHGGAHLPQLPPASVPVAALQQARGRVRRVVREPAPLRARGDRGGAGACRQRLGRRRPDQPDRLHPGRARHRGRDPGGPAARGRRPNRLRERDRGRLPQHLQGDRACGRARRLSRRPRRAGEGRACRSCRCSRSAASRIRRWPRRSSQAARRTWSP